MNINRLKVMVIACKQLWYFEHTLPRIADYCKRHDYALEIVEDDIATGSGYEHPSWNKVLHTASAVLWWDADLVPMPWAPRIEEVIEGGRFNGVRFPMRERCYRWMRERYGAKHHREMDVNCGLLYVPECYVKDVSHIDPRANHRMWEQGAINELIWCKGLEFHELDRRFNALAGSSPTPAFFRENWFVHFGGGTPVRNRGLRRWIEFRESNGWNGGS